MRESKVPLQVRGPPGRWLEVVTWSMGLALLSGYGAVLGWAEHARVEGIDKLHQIRDSPPVHQRVGVVPLDARRPSAADQSLWSATRVRAFGETVFRDTPQGVLRIPSLGLEVPIFASTSEINLNRGAGHIEGTAALEAPGNVGIAAHRDGFFRKLKDAKPGQLVFLDMRTRTVRYRIVDTRIVNPSDVSVLAATVAPSITLVTCYPFYFVGPAPQRFVVRAEIDAAGAEARRRSSELTVPSNQE
jgi:sortase A